MGLGAHRNNLKTFGTTVYVLTHPRGHVGRAAREEKKIFFLLQECIM